MRLRHARIELSVDDLDLICAHHPDDIEPTLVFIGDQEYMGNLSVERHKDTYIIKLTIKK